MIIRLAAISIMLLLSGSAMTAGQSGNDLYQQGLARETAGDIKSAIQIFERIVREFSADRTLTARALLQLGKWTELLGQDQARKYYERVISEFTDQKGATADARARLEVLAKRTTTSAAPTAATVGARPLARVDRANDLQAISADGMKATFITYDGGMNLAVYDFASRQTKALTHLDWASGYVEYGIWSPDRQRVAHAQGEAALGSVLELRSTTLDGNSRVLFRNEAAPGRSVVPADWLPDGRSILVVLGRADGTFAVGFVPAAGGPFTPLRSLQWKSGKPDVPKASPDGRLVALADGGPGMRDIHVLSVDGRTSERLTDHPADDSQPRWSPDGRYVAFISTRNGSPALWAVAVKDGKPVDEPFRVKDGMQDASLISWTTLGLAYNQRQRTDDIFTVDVDRSTWQPIGAPRQLAYSRTGRSIGPVWSPDGRALAFVSSSPGDPDRRYVVVMPEGGGEPREFLIPAKKYAYLQEPYDLRWFGDGSGLGFSTTGRGDPELFRLTLATGHWDVRPLPIKTWTRIEWNADGSRYFYARQGFTGELPVILERDIKSESERVVFRGTNNANNNGAIRGLRFGPDRRSLAFTTTSAENNQSTTSLLVVDTASGEARRITEEKSGLTFESSVVLGVPAWSPDGRMLMVTRAAGPNPSELRFFALDGADVRSFLFGAAFLGKGVSVVGNFAPAIRDVMVSQDGRRMSFVLSTDRFDAAVIENVTAGAGSSARRQ